MQISNGFFPSTNTVSGLTDKRQPEKPLQSSQSRERTFAEILNSKKEEGAKEGVRFSKHAAKRLSDRNISLSLSQINRLTEGINRAGEKGISDSLVMVDNLAFIVNTDSNTVVTAMDARDTDNNVFSNIDGAVIA